MPTVAIRMKAGADQLPSTLAMMKPCPLKPVKPTAAAAACRNTTPFVPLKASLGTALSVRTCLHSNDACHAKLTSAGVHICTASGKLARQQQLLLVANAPPPLCP